VPRRSGRGNILSFIARQASARNRGSDTSRPLFLPATLSDQRVVTSIPSVVRFRRLTVSKRATDVSFPPAVSSIAYAYTAFVGSPVALRSLARRRRDHTARCDPTGHRRFPDGTLRGTTTVIELAHGATLTEIDLSAGVAIGSNVTGLLHQPPRDRPCKARKREQKPGATV